VRPYLKNNLKQKRLEVWLKWPNPSTTKKKRKKGNCKILEENTRN
jgi:hypothetical protein